MAVWVAASLAAFAWGAEGDSKTHQSPALSNQLNQQIKPAAKKPSIEPADNSFCYVCHRNYEKELLSAAHTKQGIGCEQCHGVSERHSADEDGITPPETMFSKTRINPFCVKCHGAETLQGLGEHELALTMLKAKDKASALSSNSPGKEMKWICTDCHGEHRLKVRTRLWDKDTGKLVSDDGVRMMDKSRPGTANQR